MFQKHFGLSIGVAYKSGLTIDNRNLAQPAFLMMCNIALRKGGSMPTECTVANAGGVNKGNAVCLVGFDTGKGRPIVARATTKTLATSKTVLGVAEDHAADTETAKIRVAGEVAENDITGLGNVGGSRIIATKIYHEDPNHQAELMRIDVADGSEHVVGTCDEKGNLAIQPRASRDTSPHKVYNPKSYGCPWDGVHDDLPGWQAMIAEIPFKVSTPVVIQLPPGQGYFSDFLEISRCLIIRGQGGRQIEGIGLSHNGLRFAPLKGIILHNYLTGPDFPSGEGADGAFIEHCSISSTIAIVADPVFGNGRPYKMLDTSLDIRAARTFYEKGTCVLKFGSKGTGGQTDYFNEGATRGGTMVMFRVTTAGTTANSPEPNEFAAATVANIGDPIIDGDVTWTVESIPKDYTNNHLYQLGERVFLPGDTANYFECIVPGTSLMLGELNYGHVGIGVTCPPEMNSPLFGQSFLDDPTHEDGLKWRAHFPTGVMNLAVSCGVRSCSIAGFTGYGIYSLSNLDPVVYKSADGSAPKGMAHFGEFSDLIVSMCGGGLRFHGEEVGGSQSRNAQFYFLGGGRTNVDAAPYLNTGRDVWGTGAACIMDRSVALNGHANHYSQFSSGIPFRNDQLESNTGNQSKWYNCFAETTYACLFVDVPLVIGCGPIGPTGGGIIIDSASGRNFREHDLSDPVAITATLSNRGARALYTFDSLEDVPNFWGWSYRHATPAGYWALQWATQGSQNAFLLSSQVAGLDPVPGWLIFENGHFIGDPSTGAGSLLYRGTTASITNRRLREGLRRQGDEFSDATTKTLITSDGYRGLLWLAGQPANAATTPWGIPAYMVEPFKNGSLPDAGLPVYKCMTPGKTGLIEPATVTIRWSIGTTIIVNDPVVPTHGNWNGFWFKATDIGNAPHQTGGAEPGWKAVRGQTTQDGDIVWTCEGPAWGLQLDEATPDNDVVWTFAGLTPSMVITHGPGGGQATIAMAAANVPLTFADAAVANEFLMLIGDLHADRHLELPLPLSNAGTYKRVIRNQCVLNGNTLTIKTSLDAGLLVGEGRTVIVGVNANGTFRVTADV